jgi:hypothetical protein
VGANGTEGQLFQDKQWRDSAARSKGLPKNERDLQCVSMWESFRPQPADDYCTFVSEGASRLICAEVS